MDIMPEYLSAFGEEAEQQLHNWEEALLKLENAPGSRELLDQVFRSVHTLKGSAGFLGFDALQRIVHELESLLQEAREGGGQISRSMIELCFKGLDLAGLMVERFVGGNDFDGDIESFLSELKKNAAQEKEADRAGVPERAGAPARAGGAGGEEQAGPEATRFQIEVSIKAAGREAYLRALLVKKRLEGVGKIVSVSPSLDYLRSSSGRFVYKVVLESRKTPESLRAAVNLDLVEISLVAEAGQVKDEAAEPGRDNGRRPGTMERAARADEVVRVPVEKMDVLLNLVGELAVQNSGFISMAQQLRQIHGRKADILDLEAKTEALAKTTRDLQDAIMKVRMLAVGEVFNRFKRVVRDLARYRHKEIVLDIFGEETEIDKKVMDRIGEPLVHLIRNAVDHGIEERQERLAAGKNPSGLIRLGAYQNGDHICIEVSDDGGGLNAEEIRHRAVERGLIRADEAAGMNDERVLHFIFRPGFSTATELSDVSGRGVGMDVVQRTVDEMGGNIRINSIAGGGTSVIISLPLTMAIITAIQVEVAGSIFAIPLTPVREILKASGSNMETVGGSRAIRVRDEVLSVVHLGEALRVGPARSDPADLAGSPVIIVDCEDKKLGLAVDKIIGSGEIVIKSLSRNYREIDGLIGASILGNGKIALIVDAEAMIRTCHRDDSKTSSIVGGCGLSVREISPEPAAEQIPEREKTVPVGEVERPAAGTANVDAASPRMAVNLSGGNATLLEEIHNSGALGASLAMSKLTGREIRVSFPESVMVSLSEVADMLGGEERPVGGIYVGLTGDLTGAIMLVIPEEQLTTCNDLLHHYPGGEPNEAGRVDCSALSEMGNILAASFVNALADETGMAIKADVPEMSIDMCLAVIDSVLALFNQPGDLILLTTAQIFYSSNEELVCHLLMFLEPESLKDLLQVLARGLVEQKAG
jgi:two-component system chemotaxis sensor kinase CheA